MSRFRTLKQSTGLPPGTLVHVGEQKTEQVKISLMAYGKGRAGGLVEFDKSLWDELSLYARAGMARGICGPLACFASNVKIWPKNVTIKKKHRLTK